MSTNIQIDVVLQRLQDQSKQTQAQNRQERQDREDANRPSASQLTSKTTAPAAATPQASQRELLSNLAELRRQSADQHSSAPDTYKKRRPAAQRLGVDAVAGVAYTVVDSAVGNAIPGATRRLRIGPPGQPTYVEATFQWPSITPPTQPPSVGLQGTIALGGWYYLYYNNPDPNLPDIYEELLQRPSESTIRQFVGDTGPLSGMRTGITYGYSLLQSDQSLLIALPLNDQATLVVYDFNVGLEVVPYAVNLTEQTQSTYRQDFEGALYRGKIYDRDTTLTLDYSYDTPTLTTARSFACFVVTPTSVRQIAVPAVLEQQLRDRRPNLSLNGTLERELQTATLRHNEYIPNQLEVETITDLPGTTFSIAAFEEARYNPKYNGPGRALAMMFGIGYLTAIPHTGLPFYSPAVYQWLLEDMDVSAANSIQYAVMRSRNLPNAPAQFLSPGFGLAMGDPPGYDPAYVLFGVTTEQPVSTEIRINEALLNWNTRYRFALNGSNLFFTLVMTWNWGRESYCRQQLLRLGFTTADLTP